MIVALMIGLVLIAFMVRLIVTLYRGRNDPAAQPNRDLKR
jgi:hypothetical protein